MPRWSNSDSLARKRLRRGTHSCLECRRRKVRCKFEPNSPQCVECVGRHFECIPQEGRATTSLAPEENGGENHADLTQNVEEILARLLQKSGPPSSANVVNSIDWHKISSTLQNTQVRTPSSSQTLALNASDAGQVPNSAPLFSLFNPTASPQDHGDHVKIGALGKNDLHVLQAVKLYMPSIIDLTAILICGQHSWRIWRQTFPDQLASTLNGSQQQQATTLCGLIYTCLHSGDRALVAKTVLCTLLQIQQLPLGSKCADPVLRQNCLDSVDLLLASDDGLAGTLDGLECMMLQAEFYINLANLSKVWLIVRRAVNLAQMLGLHRSSDDANLQPSLQQRKQSLWSQLWQMDRGFSMILGLPYATFDTQYPRMLPDMHEERFLCELGVLMGRIVARNQTRGQMTYTVTLEIDEALEECKKLMPSTWWEPRKRDNTSPDMLFAEYSKKIRFHTTCKLLHLPFMLKAHTDHRYEGSRIATVKASKAIIEAFRILRDENLPAPKMCNMADFETLCAAMTIVVDLVGRHPRDDDEGNWLIILDVAKDLKRVSQVVDCSVAAKGARVLQDLYDSRNHSISSNSRLCELDIPYFGKICIRQVPLEPGLSQRGRSAENPSQALQPAVEVRDVESRPATSIDGWFFPYLEATPPWQDVYGSALTMPESDIGDDWSWFLGEGDFA